MNNEHFIGERFGGGIVFHVDETGEHGLIAATEDQSKGRQWDNGERIETGAIGDGIYAGKANTILLISLQCAGSYPAKICANYRGGGYDDWYLPSKEELYLLYQQRNIVGGFEEDFYLSSTEYNSRNMWYQSFFGGSQNNYLKYFTYRLRAIRAF